jgi:hypothetical protein
MGIKHNYVATGTDDPTKQVSVTRWNNDHVIDTEIDLPLVASPSAPIADYVAIYGQKRAGRMMLTQMGPSGLDTSLQPHLGGNKIGLWIPPGNATTVPAIFGIGTLTTVGTATTRTVTATTLASRMLRLGYISAATAGALTSLREAQNKYTTGGGDGLGGFYYRLRFIPSNAANVTGERFFAGLWATTTAATNQEPTALVNCLGICQISSSTNLQIYGAGATVGTPVDLGANFPANTLSTEAYEFAMFSAANGTTTWQVWRLGTAFTATGTFTSQPASTTFLGHQIWKTNNATALAVGVDICTLYIETDN